MNKHILVPLDGTIVAHMALPHAAALARATSSRLILLHVAPSRAANWHACGLSRATGATATYRNQRDGFSLQHRYLEATAEDMQDERLLVQTEILEGDPASVITSMAEDNPSIWTIVMATRSMGNNRFVNHSVSEKVLRPSVPILLVHPDEKMDSLRPFYLPAYQTILVPLDGSEFAEQALAPAQMLAHATGASLLLLSVVPDPYLGRVVRTADEAGGPYDKASEAHEGGRADQAERTRGYLSKIADDLRSGGLAVRAEVAYGTPAEEVLRSADDAGAGLIVMSTCCRNDLECLLGGRVVHKVTLAARLPVLLVRAQMAPCQERRNEELSARSSAKEVVAQQMPTRV